MHFSLLTINTDLQTFIEMNTHTEIKTKSSNSDTCTFVRVDSNKKTFLARLNFN